MDVDKTTEFIICIQGMPLLWKKDDKNFLNREMKRTAFAELAEISGISPDECKRKLKNLKDRMREICSKLPKTRSGQPAFEIGEKTVRWPYYKQLLFMKDEFSSRTMIRNVEGDHECPSILSDDSNDGSDAIKMQSPLSAQSTISESTEETPSKLKKRKKVLSKSKHQRVEEEFLTIEREKINSMKMALQMKCEQDEWNTFSSCICSDLRKLRDPFIILRVKASIHRIVNEAVLEQFSKDTDNSTQVG